MRSEVNPAAIKRKLDRVRSLFPAPNVAAKLLSAGSREQTEPLILSDPALTAHVLRFGAGATVARASARELIRRIEEPELRRLLLSVAEDRSDSPEPVDDDLWRHGLACALCAERVAMRIEGADPNEAYVAGLLHDLGKMAIEAVLPGAERRARDRARLEHVDHLEAEIREVGADHTQAGKWLAERWRFPGHITEAIWLHHHPPGSLDGRGFDVNLIDLVSLANLLSHNMLETEADLDARFFLPDELVERLRLTELELHAARAEARRAFDERLALLSEGAGDEGDADGPSSLADLLETNARLEAEARQARDEARRSRVFAALAGKLWSGLSLDDILDATVDAVRNGLGFGSGLCWVADATGRCIDGATWTPSAAGPSRLFVDVEDGTASETDRAALQALTDLGFSMGEEGWASTRLVDMSRQGGLIAVPMLADGRSFGQIVLDPEGVNVSENLVTALTVVAETGARAVARRHAEERDAAQYEDLVRSLRHTMTPPEVDSREGPRDSEADLATRMAEALEPSVQTISTQAQRLRARTRDPDAARSLDTIMDRGRYIGKALANLQVFWDRFRPRLEPNLVNYLLHQLVLAEQDRLEKKRTRVTELYAEGLPRVLLDRQQMEQVFLNLLMNAEEAMADSGGTLTIQTGANIGRDSVIIRFSDTGPGIAKSRLSQIFEPFSTTKEGAGTAGLGLAVCRGVVENHGGRIEVASALGEGSTFTVVLPAAHGAAPHREAMDSVIGLEIPPSPAELPVVLVVDDDEGVRDILKQTLQMRGYVVKTAVDGVDALETLEFGPVNLIVLDLSMPRKDGLSVLAELRDRPNAPPVIVMTGSTNIADIEEAGRQGARTCLNKPFELRRLLAEVESAVEEQRA